MNFLKNIFKYFNQLKDETLKEWLEWNENKWYLPQIVGTSQSNNNLASPSYKRDGMLSDCTAAP